MKKTCLKEAVCPLSRAYDAIGDWWSLLIVSRVVMRNLRRFCEIQEDLGMARNILANRLKKLVDEGILEKVPAADGSAYQEYAPTAKGRDLHVVMVAMLQWGEKYFFDNERVQYTLVDARKHQPIAPLRVKSATGRTLRPDEIATLPTDKVAATGTYTK